MGLLEGVVVIDLAVVTASGSPIVAPVDAVFLRGKFWFGLPPGSVRGRILRTRPQVSAAGTRGTDGCVIVHGAAREVRPGSTEYAEYDAYLREVYGETLEYSRALYRERVGTDYNGWIEARKLFATRPHPE